MTRPDGAWFDSGDLTVDPSTPEATRHAAAVLIAAGLDPTQAAQMLGLLPTVPRHPRRKHHRTSER